MQELQYSQRNFLDKDLSRNAILLYGYSDGGGGPTREMVARIRRDHDLAGAPSIDFGTPDELFDRVRHDIVDEAPDETGTASRHTDIATGNETRMQAGRKPAENNGISVRRSQRVQPRIPIST